jgi:hypothetical protein
MSDQLIRWNRRSCTGPSGVNGELGCNAAHEPGIAPWTYPPTSNPTSAAGPPLPQHPDIAGTLNAKQELSMRLLEPVFDHLFEQASRDRQRTEEDPGGELQE